jgi:hypothetical protein
MDNAELVVLALSRDVTHFTDTVSLKRYTSSR